MIPINPENVLRIVRELDFPRVAGSDGEARAFAVIKDPVEELGVPVSFEEFEAPQMEFTEAFVEIHDRKFSIEPLASPIRGAEWSPIPETLDVAGRLLEPPIPGHEAGPFIALRTHCDIEQPGTPGASAELFACQPEDSFVAYYLACGEELVPAAHVGVEHETLLSNSIGGICRVHWDSQECARTFRNMIAEIKGSTVPCEVVVVGAHIDSFPGTVGASDNASGSALLVEFAKYFASHAPARTVRFVWFTREEVDRRGSNAYVAAHVRDEDRICLYVNLDSGVSIEHGEPQVAVTGGTRLVTATEDLMANMGKEITVHESDFGSVDAAAFHEYGIPTVFAHARRLTPYPHPHLPSDRFDKLDAKKIELIGGLSLAIVDAGQSGKLPLKE